jgi:hypothetical protein
VIAVKTIDLGKYEPEWWTDRFSRKVPWRLGRELYSTHDHRDEKNPDLGIKIETLRRWRDLIRLVERARSRHKKAVGKLFAKLKEMAPDATREQGAIFNLGGGNTLDYDGRGFSYGTVDRNVEDLMRRSKTVYRVFGPELCTEVRKLLLRDHETRRHFSFCYTVMRRSIEDRIRTYRDECRSNPSHDYLIEPFTVVLTPHILVRVSHDSTIDWIETEVLHVV